MKTTQQIKVININKHGVVFQPSEYIVRKSENPELYKFLEAVYDKRRNGR